MVSESCASPKIPPFSAISICEHSAGHSPLPDTSPTSSGLPRSPSPSWTDNGTSDTRSEVLRPGTSFQESIGGSGDVIRPIGSDAILQASMRRRERNPSYFCPYQGCGASFTARHNLKNHVNSHKAIRPFTCKGCHRSFGTKHVLKRHKNTCGYYRQFRATDAD